MLEAVPCQVHTDDGIEFAEQPRNRNNVHSRPMRFDMISEANGFEHRLTKRNHPWSHEDRKTIRWIAFPNGGQVERMNRTIKDATVRRFHYDSHDQLRTPLADFLAACNFARRLKTLGGLTPYEYICKIWASEPDRFILNPIHQMPGLNPSGCQRGPDDAQPPRRYGPGWRAVMQGGRGRRPGRRSSRARTKDGRNTPPRGPDQAAWPAQFTWSRPSALAA